MADFEGNLVCRPRDNLVLPNDPGRSGTLRRTSRLCVDDTPVLGNWPTILRVLGMLVGMISKSVESAAVVGNLITFPMMFLSGTFFPVSLMPMYLQNIAHVLPLFYLIDGLNQVMIYANSGQALFDLELMVVLSAIAFVFAVVFFKWRED